MSPSRLDVLCVRGTQTTSGLIAKPPLRVAHITSLVITSSGCAVTEDYAF
jgi:hypothetical protein